MNCRVGKGSDLHMNEVVWLGFFDHSHFSQRNDFLHTSLTCDISACGTQCDACSSAGVNKCDSGRCRDGYARDESDQTCKGACRVPVSANRLAHSHAHTHAHARSMSLDPCTCA